MTKILFGDYLPDVASFDSPGTAIVKNVLPATNGYSPLKGIASFTGVLPARCLGYFSCVDDSNTVHIFAGTSTKLYKLNLSTRAWADVSKSGSYSVSTREYWSFAQFGSNVVAVTNGNPPQVYDLSSSTLFADLGGSPPQARRVSVIGDFLVLQGLTSNPKRIQWSALNDITGWTPGTDSSDYQEFPDGGFVRGVGGGEFGIVFQDNAIRRMIFNPVSPTIFDFNRISKDRGLYMPYSLAESHSSLFFYAADGFYRVDASGALSPIGANKINQTFLDDADLSDPRYLVGAADPSSQRVFWAYKSMDNASTAYLDKCLIYDWAKDRWSYAEISLEYISKSSPVSVTLESLDTIGNLDALTVSLDGFIMQTQEALSAFNTAHQLGFFNGSTLEATVETAEGAIGEGQRMMTRDIAPIGDAFPAYVSIKTRSRLEDNQITSAEAVTGVRGYAPIRVSGRFMTGRVRIPAGEAWTYLRGIDVEASNEGFR